MADRIGNDRVKFLKGKIQDLALDVEAMEQWLQDHPVSSAATLVELDKWKAEQRRGKPLVEDATVDLVISNCVLNLVSDVEKQQLVDEIYRVVKPGGRIAISDIVSDEIIPDRLKADEQLWSGCISGAFHELEMLQMFRQAGFVAISYDRWSSKPWQVVEGIEFRAVTLTAIKPELTGQVDKGHAVIYRGPYAAISDDEGNEYPRGERMAVSEAVFLRLGQAPFKDDFICIEPVSTCAATEWNAPAGTRREASETKGARHANINQQSPCC